MHNLLDYVIMTEPLLPEETLAEVVAITEGVEWRVPGQGVNYTRTCTTFPLSAAAVGGYPLPDKDRLARVKKADEALVSATRRALAYYKEKIPRVLTRTDSGFDILKYEVGQLITYHMDDLNPRVLSLSISLNDDYTGGEFRFWEDDNAVFRVPAGCAMMFPPNFMYGHEILPVLSGTRYSMITWFS